MGHPVRLMIAKLPNSKLLSLYLLGLAIFSCILASYQTEFPPAKLDNRARSNRKLSYVGKSKDRVQSQCHERLF